MLKLMPMNVYDVAAGPAGGPGGPGLVLRSQLDPVPAGVL